MPSDHARDVERFWGLPVPSHLRHGSNSRAARAYGCDCKLCLPSGKRRSRRGEGKTVWQRQKESRDRLRNTPVPPGVKHGVYAYRTYNCRCPVCRAVLAEAKQRQENAWRETAHGHWRTEGGMEIIHWLPRDAERPWLCPTCDHKEI